MPEKIQNPIASTALAKEFGVKGRIALSLDETIVPIALVSDLTDDGTKAWGIALAVGAGGAGTYGKTQILNPAGSGLLVFVDQLIVVPTGTQRVIVVHEDTGIGITATPFFLDRRIATGADGVSPRPRCELHSATAGASTAGNIIAAQQWINGQPVPVFQLKVVLTPSTGVEAGVALVNSDSHYWWQGRIRSLTPEEAREFG